MRKYYLVSLGITLLISLVFWGLVSQDASRSLVSPLLEAVALDLPGDGLKGAINGALEGAEGRYGVVVKNLQTGESFTLRENEQFEAGSLYKLWVMATAFKQIESGELQKDQILSQKIEALNRRFKIDEQSAELTEGEITLTVAQAINQTITISHNYAALLLSEQVRLSAVEEFLDEYELVESSLGDPPTTTPLDIALFFEKLYKGELGTRENSEEMLEILSRQQLNNKLPKYLPKKVKVAHKTGEIGWFSHDTGIVYSEEGDYLIVVMSESNFPLGAAERIGRVSEAVYNYFARR